MEQMIVSEMYHVDEDLASICNNLQLSDNATLGAMRHYENVQCITIQLNVNEDGVTLLQRMQSLDYADKFKSFLTITYNKRKIGDEEKPRLILVVKRFSEVVRSKVESTKGMHVGFTEWEYLKCRDHNGVRLETILAWAPTEEPKKEQRNLQVRKRRTPKREAESVPNPRSSILFSILRLSSFPFYNRYLRYVI